MNASRASTFRIATILQLSQRQRDEARTKIGSVPKNSIEGIFTPSERGACLDLGRFQIARLGQLPFLFDVTAHGLISTPYSPGADGCCFFSK